MEQIKETNYYRERKANGKYNYYEKRICNCGEEYFTSKYNPSSLCDTCSNKSGRAGRPSGHKLSAKSKDRIRKGRLGQTHNDVTRAKISESIKKAFESGLYTLSGIKGKDHPLYKHGCRPDNSTEYTKWRGIIDRCVNPKHSDFGYYGAKGITVCDEWKDDFLLFKEFLERNGYVSGKHLHRIDNEGPYAPDNVIVLDASTHSKLHWIMKSYRENKK